VYTISGHLSDGLENEQLGRLYASDCQNSRRHAVVNLELVTHITQEGLGTLFRVYQSAITACGNLVFVVRPEGRIESSIRRFGFHHVFTIKYSLDDALETAYQAMTEKATTND
jgi:anti-anti-sigma regulatory factor